MTTGDDAVAVLPGGEPRDPVAAHPEVGGDLTAQTQGVQQAPIPMTW